MKDEISPVFLLEVNCINYSYKFDGKITFNNPNLTFLQLTKLLEKYLNLTKREILLINSCNYFKTIFENMRGVINSLTINKYIKRSEEIDNFYINVKISKINFYKEKDL